MVTLALAGALFAGRALAPSRPAVVGIVDLEAVFNRSFMWANRQANIEKLGNDLETRVGELKATVEELDTELQSFQAGSPAALQLQARVFEAVGEYNAFRQFAQLKLESARSEAMRETYEEIQKIAKVYATSANIDLVLVDDSIPEMKRGDSNRTVQQISARRLLYATNEFNITQELLAEFNAKLPLDPGVTAPSGSSGSALSGAAPEKQP